MSYRIEFFASETSAQVPTPLNGLRFPNFVLAITAARMGARLLAQDFATPLPLVVDIFDREERLASRMQLEPGELRLAANDG